MKLTILSECILKSFKPLPADLENKKLQRSDIESLCRNDQSLPPSLTCYKSTSNSSIIISTDPIRSIPVFYCMNEHAVYISEHAEDLLKFSSRNTDALRSAEFLLLGVTTGSSTLIRDIKQLQAGEYLWIEGDSMESGLYTDYLTNTVDNTDSFELEKQLTVLFREIFSSLIQKLNGRMAIIPLSGGYDSRLIVYWLKKLNYPNVRTITYGRPGNPEIENAGKTAGILQIPWEFIDYTKLPITNFIHSELFVNFYPFSGNLSSMFFMQDYFALYHLKYIEKIPSDAVFIPGHSGDFLGGSHLTANLQHDLSPQQLADVIFHKYYNSTSFENTRIKQELLTGISQHLPKGYPAHSIFEDWVMRERQAKFIVNSARAFSYFGYDYFLPLWDIRLVNFFKTLPFERKIYKNFYNKVLIQLFKEQNIHFAKELQASKSVYFQYQLKQSIKRMAPVLGRLKKLDKKDNICYKEITESMRNELVKAGIPLHKAYSYNSFLLQWYLAKVQGIL